MQQVEMVIVVMRQMGTRKIDTCRTQMEEDDTDTDGDSDTDKSDELDEEQNEEDVPIPCSWNHDFSSAATIILVSIIRTMSLRGERFLNKRHLHEAIIKREMSTQR
jgi:hypothetical protein